MTKGEQNLTSSVPTVLIAVLSFVVIMVVLWFNQREDPQDAQLATGTPNPAAQFFRVVPEQSQLRVTVDSQFGDISGGYEMGEGTVELSRADAGWRVHANLTFDARTLDIGNDQLNTVMRRALEVETYPNGIFIATNREPVPDLSVARTTDLVGQLELHGQVQEYTIPTTITLEGDTLTLRAQIVIDAGDFGVSIPSLVADEDLDANLRIVAQRNSSDAMPGSPTPSPTPGD